MEVRTVAPGGPDLAEPRAVAGNGFAQLLLDAGVYEDALDFGEAGRLPEQRRVHRRPSALVDVKRAIPDERLGADRLALGVGEAPLGHGHEPDVGVEADLVRGMPAGHWPATRLRDVADEQPVPAVLRCLLRKLPDQADHLRMPPAAVARKAHHLPVRSVRRERHAAGKAAMRVEAERFGRG